MSWSADISYLVKRRSHFTKRTFSFFWAIHKCPLNFEVEGKDESFWHRGALSLNSSKYQQCRGYFPQNVIFIRCASISWFEVVTQWVSYFFLQLAHLRVFQIILFDLDCIILSAIKKIYTYIFTFSFKGSPSGVRRENYRQVAQESSAPSPVKAVGQTSLPLGALGRYKTFFFE